jgi:nitrite reductase/ring-hydroxylating ferredoxin subunit
VSEGSHEDGWQRVAAVDELREGRTHRVSIDGLEAFLVKDGDRIYALGLRCTHQGAPLDRGALRLTGTPLTVTCPAHGSMFDLTDGQVRRGPAMHPIPAFDTRVTDGTVEVRSRLPGAG